MKEDKKLSSTVLLLNLVSLILIILLFSGFAINYDLAQNIQTENTKRLDLILNANRFIDGSLYLTQEVRTYSVTGDRVHYDNYWNEVNTLKNRDIALDEMIRIGITDDERKIVQAMGDLSNYLIPLEEKAMQSVEQENLVSAIDYVYGNAYQVEIEKIYTLQDEFLNMLDIRTKNAIQGLSNRNIRWIIEMIVWLVLLIVLQIANFIVIQKKILIPIKYATEHIQYLAEGDLSFENKLSLYRTQKNEIGIVARSLHTLQANISRVFKDIFSVAQQVADGSRQISTSSQSVSSIASEQAASTEEISSTMEEMAANIRQNADNAIKTGSISKQAVENAHMGKEAVNESLVAVKKIASEISIIDGIASQTNLLALNAAIEAARAGDAGKGFAVVASEVRKLAEKSQIAATEINMLSSTTIVAAERASEVISTVIPRIEQTAGLVEEISFASKEQDTGAQQVNQALVQMDVGVQQNASSSEELASMAETLSNQATQLMHILNFFKLAEVSKQKQPSAVKFIENTGTVLKQKKLIQRNDAFSKNVGTQNYHDASNVSDFEEF